MTTKMWITNDVDGTILWQGTVPPVLADFGDEKVWDDPLYEDDEKYTSHIVIALGLDENVEGMFAINPMETYLKNLFPFDGTPKIKMVKSRERDDDEHYEAPL